MTVDLEALTHERRNRLSTDTTQLICLCIHPVEGHGPHEHISGADYCGEIERVELVIASKNSDM